MLRRFHRFLPEPGVDQALRYRPVRWTSADLAISVQRVLGRWGFPGSRTTIEAIEALLSLSSKPVHRVRVENHEA
eukprot:274502-Pleurochrysis_carterae.AAC.4